MNLDLGLLARALIARVMQLEQENAKLREQLSALAEQERPKADG